MLAETGTIAGIVANMQEKEDITNKPHHATWLDRVHTSGQIFLLTIACLLVLLSTFDSGIQSGMLVGTVIAIGWFILGITWWLLYRLVLYIKPPRTKSSR